MDDSTGGWVACRSAAEQKSLVLDKERIAMDKKRMAASSDDIDKWLAAQKRMKADKKNIAFNENRLAAMAAQRHQFLSAQLSNRARPPAPTPPPHPDR